MKGKATEGLPVKGKKSSKVVSESDSEGSYVPSDDGSKKRGREVLKVKIPARKVRTPGVPKVSYNLL